MSIANTSDVWLTAAVNATNDFVINALDEQYINSSSLDEAKRADPTQLSGAYLLLDCGAYQVEVGVLVDLENLMQITRKMLSLSPQAPLDREQMSDALNEIVNIISGGIKSRLNDQVEGGITLGLPRFLTNTEISRHDTIFLHYGAGDDLCLSISVRLICD